MDVIGVAFVAFQVYDHQGISWCVTVKGVLCQPRAVPIALGNLQDVRQLIVFLRGAYLTDELVGVCFQSRAPSKLREQLRT